MTLPVIQTTSPTSPHFHYVSKVSRPLLFVISLVTFGLLHLTVSVSHSQPSLGGGGAFEVTDLQKSPTDSERPTLFTDIDPQSIGIDFINRYEDPAMWGRLYREFTLGSVGAGVAIGDFDQDGRPDIYAVSKTGPNALFRKTDTFTFENVTEQAGVAGNPDCWATGVSSVDINNDGLLDIYLCNFAAPNQLFVNQGDGTFVESAARYGLAIVDASVMASFADYDRDGDLDLYLLTNVLDYRTNSQGRPDYLYQNNGDLTFTDVTETSGISGIAQGHSATWWDFDQDGWPDLYVANDFEASDRLYRNNGDGTFTDVIASTLPLTPYFSMGSDLGDINNDGLVDFFVGDMAATSHEKEMIGIAEINRTSLVNEREDSQFPMYMRNAFFLNTGTGYFNEIAYLNQLDASDWTWAARFADLDNDGWNDLFITNGNIRNFMEADLLEEQNVAASLAARIRVYKDAPLYKEQNLAFRNKGSLKFVNVSKKWGLDFSGISFGTAFSDLDRDGDLDIVINNHEENLKIYRNESSKDGLLLSLKGVSTNQYGIGAEVTLTTPSNTQIRQHTTARGLLSSDEPLIHFGLPESDGPATLEIKWPSGHEQTLSFVSPGKSYLVTEPSSPASLASSRIDYRDSAQFTEVSDSLGLEHTHAETYVNEFDQQYLLPRRLSRQGPPISWIEPTDASPILAIGGAAGEETKTYAFESGRFKPLLLLEAHSDNDSETLGIAGLGNTIYFANGGVEGSYEDLIATFNTDKTQPLRLAEAQSDTQLPSTSTSTLATADFDGDGDLDLFVGGRSLPGSYPSTPDSYLLENREGRFVDVTDQVAPNLRRVGMVTSALWSDYDGDSSPDLLLALEWGSVTLFRNQDGNLVDVSEPAGFSSITGWWNSIVSADFNRDGLPDYAVGNLGLNTKYSASQDRPTTLYYGEFDDSGRKRIIEAQYTDGDDNLYPIRPYSLLRFAFPNLRDKFASYREFAQASLAEVFSQTALDNALRKSANTLESGVFLSNGKGNYRFTLLPRETQIAPVYGMVAQDFNGDGFVDLYCVQNSFSPEPSTGRFAGGLSLLLLGDGKGGFDPVRPDQSGLIVKGDGKAAISTDLNDDGWADLIVSQNSGKLLAFRNEEIEGANSLSIALQFSDTNPRGIGSKIVVSYKDGTKMYSEMLSHSGYLSQSASKLFVGYVTENPPTSISVSWPDGNTTSHPFDTRNPTLLIKYQP